MIKKMFVFIWEYLLKPRWDKELNTFQNLFLNLYLPDSKGNPSMHTTLLVLIGIIPMVVFIGVQLYIYVTTKVQPPTEFYVLMGTIGTGLAGMFAYRENKKLDS